MDWIRSGRGRTRALAGVAVALAFGGLGLRGAQADLCSDCKAPTGQALEDAAGFTLETREGWPYPKRDYVETDGGACDVRIEGDPHFEMVNSYLVLAGTGEVWDCPDSYSCDTMSISYEAERGDEWTTGGEVSGGLSFGGVSLTAKLLESIKRSERIRTVTRGEKRLCAKYCHRVRWEGYFEVGDFRCTVEYTVTRIFAWWTKNDNTGDVVHQKGTITVSCGGGSVTFSRLAPIKAFFKLFDGPCENAKECESITTTDLGWFPEPGTTPITPTDPEPAPVTPGEEPDVDIDDSSDLPAPPTGTGDSPTAASGEDDDPEPPDLDPNDMRDDWWPVDETQPTEPVNNDEGPVNDNDPVSDDEPVNDQEPVDDQEPVTDEEPVR